MAIATQPTVVPIPRVPACLIGLAGSTITLAIWATTYQLGLTPFPPFDLADLLIRHSPGGLASWAIETFGHTAQRLLLAAATASSALLLALPALVLRRHPTPLTGAVGYASLIAPTVAIVVAAGTVPSGLATMGDIILLGLPLVLTGWLVGDWLNRWRDVLRTALADQQTHWLASAGSIDRRALLQRVAATTVAITSGAFVIGWLGRQVGAGSVATGAGNTLPDLRATAVSLDPTRSLPTPVAPAELPEQFDAPPDIRPRITPTSEFYVVDISTRDPALPEDNWTLHVRGLVERPLILSWNDLLALPSVDLYGTLMCISYTHGSDLISTTRWTGVPLRHVLQQAGAMPDVVDVVLHGANGYSDSIPLERALRADTLLAYGMDGRALPREHGFPCRVYVPGIYGEKNVKWLQAIELVNYDYSGYWQERGWTDLAIINTMSTIDAPFQQVFLDRTGVVPIGGIAFAGDRGISRVELRIDDGPWQAATVEEYEPALMWQRWRFDWQPTPGEYRLTVRAYDGAGIAQDETERPPHPDGQTGLDQATLQII